MSQSDYILLIAGMGLVTYVPRLLPLYFLSRRSLPQWLIDWLDLIPVAILSALIAPLIFTSGDPRQLDLIQPGTLVAIPTLAFAIKTRSMGGTVLLGMALYWGLTQYWPA